MDINVKDLNKIQLTRIQLNKWVHLPFFNDLARGCFVRLGLGVGPDQEDDQSLYQISEIIRVHEIQHPYEFNAKPGSTAFKTNRAIRIRHGKSEKIYKMQYVSNSPFTQDELERWVNERNLNNIALPTMDEIRKKEKEIRKANDYVLREEDVAHIVREKQKFKSVAINYAVKKSLLLTDLETALILGDHARAKELNKQIKEIDEATKSRDKRRTEGSNMKGIIHINERNRKRNLEQAEKAIKEEREESFGKREDAPYTRRHTKPHRPHPLHNGANQSQVVEDEIIVLEDVCQQPLSMSQESVGSEPSNEIMYSPNPGQLSQEVYAAINGEQSTTTETEAWLKDSVYRPVTSSVIDDDNVIFMDGPIPAVLNPTGIDLFALHDFVVDLDLDMIGTVQEAESSSSPLTPINDKENGLAFEEYTDFKTH